MTPGTTLYAQLVAADVPYVLVRSDGKYVARQGQAASYTSKLERARLYTTRAQAEADRCSGNETIRALEEILHP